MNKYPKVLWGFNNVYVQCVRNETITQEIISELKGEWMLDVYCPDGNIPSDFDRYADPEKDPLYIAIVKVIRQASRLWPETPNDAYLHFRWSDPIDKHSLEFSWTEDGGNTFAPLLPKLKALEAKKRLESIANRFSSKKKAA